MFKKPAKVYSATVVGLDARLVEVEADTSRGLVRFNIVGLPDIAVQEAKERVRSGIKNSGFDFPPGAVTINLAPADLKKEGPRFDLPIAVAILMARGELRSPDKIHKKLFIGELSLHGRLRPVSGVLPIAMAAKKNGIEELYLAAKNAKEASLVKGIKIFPVDELEQLVEHLRGRQVIGSYVGINEPTQPEPENLSDMSSIRGQEQAKRALEIAAAGGHNVLMTGPPGSGKTLLARTMPTILPSMTFDESLEVTKIYSVSGRLSAREPMVRTRPFRSPHHTISSVALVGGGSFPKPGEISLAHRGVLFLDEFSEFSRLALESLRQPLEDGVVTVSRAAGSVEFPARFTLVAARNPCPCGYLNDQRQACTCSPHQIIRYQKKISGPLLDRIDIHIVVPRLEYEKISAAAGGETSRAIRQRVASARQRQSKRFFSTSIVANAEMGIREIDNNCRLSPPSREFLKKAVNQFYLSARAYHRVLKVARTIADLAGEEEITTAHLAESLQYRPQME
ncbi:MAG: YifB family Mg chelatase-like AAA ATPase [Patescibacteria group bacterium]|jgi:magnesium chelatase family protein